jgi:Domain of unknown function (DUF3883)
MRSAHCGTLAGEDLALKVKHLSKEVGDGLGYDIHSFDLNGSDRLLEVKNNIRNLDDAILLI